MGGTVTSYSGTSLVVNVNATGGSGTFTDWTVHTMPDNNTGSSGLAASTTTNFMYVANAFPGLGGNGPWYTTDGGVHWTSVLRYLTTNFGIPTTNNTGFGTNFELHNQLVAADQITANTFYLYNGLSSGSGGGVYKSTDSGATWAQQLSGQPNGSTNENGNTAMLKAVPSNAGHLFFTTRFNGGEQLSFSNNGGTSWTSVSINGLSSTNKISAFGFGATFPGQSYPAIYVVGYGGSVSNANWGVWRCTNFNPSTASGTWTPTLPSSANGNFLMFM
jgi:hypothetical protein